MTLTHDDVQAIITAIRPVVAEIVTEIVSDAFDVLARQTAAGFAEVNEKIATLQNTVDRIERIQLAEIQRSDRLELSLNHMRTALHSA